MPDRPNILLIYPDQHRRNALGCYGDRQVRTPHLDALAADGIRMERAMTSVPVCSPARACLQTGRHPWEHGVVHNDLYIRRDLKTLPQYFNEAGYTTCYIGKAHWIQSERPGFVPPDWRLGWQHWHGHNRGHFHFDPPDFDEAGNVTHRHRGRFELDVQLEHIEQFWREHDGPWLMQWNISPPHQASFFEVLARPGTRERLREVRERLNLHVSDNEIFADERILLEADFPQQFVDRLLPDGYLEQYPAETLRLDPNVPDRVWNAAHYALQEYYAMVTCVDDYVQRALEALEARGLRENSIVIYTSDHGDTVGAHGWLRWKNFPLQNACRVPLIAAGPGLAQGEVCDQTVCSLDLLPTLCELAGIEADPGLPGRSLASWLRGERSAEPRRVITGLNRWRGVFDGRFFYAMQKIEARWRTVRLIDTHADPWDLFDLQHESDSGAVREDLHDWLLGALRAAGDPLLDE